MMDYWILYILTRIVMAVMMVTPIWFLYWRTMAVINRNEEEF